MPRYFGGCLSLFLVAGVLQAADPQGKIVRETWDGAYVEGVKVGFVHTTAREIKKGEDTILTTTVELDLTLKRFRDTAHMRMETGTHETREGKVLGVFMRQYLGKEQSLVMEGTVEGDQLHVLVDGGRRLDKKIPWNDEVVGLYQQEAIFRQRKVKPGDRFSYQSFEPQLNTVMTTRVKVQDFEEVEIPGARKPRRLLRVESISDKIAGFQPPPLITWLDEDLNPVRSQVDMPPLGKLLLVRTTGKDAQGKPENGVVARIPDIGGDQLIPVNRKIYRPYDTRAAVFRVTVKGDDDPTSTFAQDSRQQIKNAQGNSFEVHIQANRRPQEVKDPDPVKDEYSKSCYFINCDDAKVKQHARQAVGEETDAWRKARLIEKWVHDNLRNKNFSEAFATADHVARTLEGDCTEHAVLAAAMCRAVGVPSRTAVGLVYIDSARGPTMGFHMWTEVWALGQWLSIDATLGKGYVGAMHLKIADHSWYETQSLTPLLSVVRVLGKTTIEVVSTSAGE